jgi:hypothetical protein
LSLGAYGKNRFSELIGRSYSIQETPASDNDAVAVTKNANAGVLVRCHRAAIAYTGPCQT